MKTTTTSTRKPLEFSIWKSEKTNEFLVLQVSDNLNIHGWLKFSEIQDIISNPKWYDYYRATWSTNKSYRYFISVYLFWKFLQKKNKNLV